MDLQFTKDALKQLEKVPKKDLARIRKKLQRFSDQENPLLFAKKLVNSYLGTWRWRVGEWRIIFDIDEKGTIIIVLLIGKRKDIY